MLLLFPLPRLCALLALLILGVTLPGCASLSRNDALGVSLVDVRGAGQSTAFESSLAVTLRLTNESAEPLAVTGSRHKLTLNGRAIGVAVSPEPLEVPALSTATQTVTLNLSHLALLGLLREVNDTRAVTYRVESMLLTGGLGRARRATHTGTIDLRALTAQANQLGGFATPAPAVGGASGVR